MWPVMSKIFPDADRTPRHDLTDHCDGPADLNPGTLVLGGADGCIMFAAQGLLDWPGEERRCPRGDLNPHALIRALAPQASASANSATRTSAEGTLATGEPIPHIGSEPGSARMGPCPATSQSTTVSRRTTPPTTRPRRSSTCVAT